MSTQLLFLGFVVSSKGIMVDQKKVDVILTWPTPTTVTELMSFFAVGNIL